MTHTTVINRRSVALKGALILLTLVAILTGVVFARALFAKRQFTAPLKVKLCGKSANGTWTTLDSFELPNANISASLLDLASSKSVSSNFVASGRSQQGKQVGARLVRDGKAVANLTTGFVELELPIEFSVEGKRVNSLLKMTTETVAGPDGGMISGKRGVIDTASRSARIAYVGNARVEQARIAEVLEIFGKRFEPNDPKRIVELLVVAQMEGILRAVD